MPRKWRIAALDQAAECYRRWAEQDRALKEDNLAKIHLERAREILEQAFARNDCDRRMGVHYSEIIEDALFAAVGMKAESYAMEQADHLWRTRYLFETGRFKKLTREHVVNAFGEEFLLRPSIRYIEEQNLWANGQPSSHASSNHFEPSGARMSGHIKTLPPGMTFGFLKDEEGTDWFFHRSGLNSTLPWHSLKEGDPVSFKRSTDGIGRPKAVEVVVMRQT